jgi:hypothetical protein
MKTVHVAEAERPLSIARLTWFRWLEIKAVNNRRQELRGGKVGKRME